MHTQEEFKNYDVKIHSGGNAAWDSSEATLNWIKENVKPGMNTIETGAGKSTLVFAQMGANHIAITPSESEIANIKKVAAANDIDLSKTTFYANFSQDILPKIMREIEYDIVHIDGGHGFPIPQIDFFFTAPSLKIGGKMVIDDVDLWTGSIIVDFLRKEKGWKIDEIMRGRTAIITKTEPYIAREWCHQPYVVAKSKYKQYWRKFKNGFSLILKADFKKLLQKFAHEKALKEAAKNDVEYS